MKEACCPIYPEVMAEKQMLLEKERLQSRPQAAEEPLGLEADFIVKLDPNDKPGKCAWKVVVVPLTLFLLIVHAIEEGWFAQFMAACQRNYTASSIVPTHHEIADIRQSWGQYSPYFDQSSPISAETPTGCETTFVQVLSRHGSRFPTSKKSELYAELFDRLVPLIPREALVGPYAYLANYSYDLGSNDLTVVGQTEMADLALNLYGSYADLVTDKNTDTLFVRASGSDRVIASAEIFSRAWKLRRLDDLPPSTDPNSVPDISVLVVPEDDSFNNTLDRNRCTNMRHEPYNHFAKHAQKTFADHFILPIAERLNSDLQLQGDDKLDIDETTYIMDVCPFETVALLHPFPPSNRTSNGVGISPICDIFSDEDFRVYDYFQTLKKYYGWSHGNPLAPSTGIGFVNELIARLTGEPVHDSTSTNRTLDGDNSTFPVGRQPNGKVARVFADFSHDNTIASIHAALRLFEDAPLLPTTRIADLKESGGFSAAATVPFGGRTVIERLRCEDREEEDVRVIVDAKVMPLKSCGGDEHGRCTLSRFVESLHFAREGGNWESCFD